MKKIALLSLVALFATATISFAGGKGKGNGKCCKKGSKECKEKSESKPDASKSEGSK